MAHPPDDPAFEALLEHLKSTRGFDFTGYKRSSLIRRVEKRLKAVEAPSWEAYQGYLEAYPEEFAQLFNTILINVTSFFRDPEAWDALARTHLPGLLQDRSPERPLRVWSAGCASGAETYTLVMVLAEALGMEGFRDRVKVYATDVDDEALAQARAAFYPERELAGLPPGFREKYFEPSGHGWVFRPDLRRHVIFGRHDLVQDAPISHLDLLMCRNTLMYFNTEVQARIMARFHFALNADGLLFLGKAEMMRAHGGLFAPVDLKARIFSKTTRAALRDRMLLLRPPQREDGTPARPPLGVRLRDAALSAGPTAQVVVDPQGVLCLANEPARVLFGLKEEDVGSPLQDLKLSYRPVELRSRIDQVTAERRAVSLPHVEFPSPEGEPRTFDVQITPLLEAGALLGVSVAFVDVTRFQRLQAELEQSHQELETAYEELQSTNEELETTNEELQSTIEELETTNEELQSTNEELETMNEELQSTNEELETINEELRRRTEQLDHVNGYMSSILTSLRLGVVVLDREMHIRVWNRKTEDLWGLRADEVEGHGFLRQDIGLPVELLEAPLRECLDGRSEQEERVLDARNRRGRAIQVRVTCTPLLGGEKDIHGAILVMEEWTNGKGGGGENGSGGG